MLKQGLIHQFNPCLPLSLRDRLAYGFLDAAHCLSAMLPAAALGIDQLTGVVCGKPLEQLSVNQAFISLRQDLCYELGIQPGDDEQNTSRNWYRLYNRIIPSIWPNVYKYSILPLLFKRMAGADDSTTGQEYPADDLSTAFHGKGIAEQVFDGFWRGRTLGVQAKLEGYSFIVAASQNVIPKLPIKSWPLPANGQTVSIYLEAVVKAVQKSAG